MAISLIRSLSATVIRNVSALKRDAKRLHKHSKLVFGTEYPLSTCQRALAVSRGFRSLEDVEKLALRLGMDRDAPFYSIRSRNDTHQAVLNALFRLELEYTESKPVVVMGEQRHAILPALVLFLEHMSFVKKPGLILVETNSAALQDTLVQDAVATLGVDEIVEGFRTLDLRDANLPAALYTDTRSWARIIADVLSKDVASRLQKIGWFGALETSAHENARSRNQLFGDSSFTAIPFFEVRQAAYHLASEYTSTWPVWMSDEAQSDLGRTPPRIERNDRDQVVGLVEALEKRNFSVGTSAEHESRWRPYVALFSRDDPASEVLAGVLHSYFYWRQASERERHSPILYISDGPEPYAPPFLTSGGYTAVVNGLTELPSGDGPGEFYGYKSALKATASPDGLQFMGTRVAFS